MTFKVIRGQGQGQEMTSGPQSLAGLYFIPFGTTVIKLASNDCLQNDLRIRSVRLQNEIDAIQRRIALVSVKLTTEMKV